jgi:hypothetical protein
LDNAWKIALKTWQRIHSTYGRGRLGVVVLTVLSLAMWLLTVHDANFSRMGQLGLVSILGWTYFVGLVLVTMGFANELLRTPLRKTWLLVFVLLLALYIFGTGSAVEPIASLPDSYRHAGLLEFIFQNGYARPHYVADFSWPGAFSLGSVFVAFAGQTNALGFTRWFPFFIELLYLAPLIVIVRSIGVGRRAAWFGIALFYTTDWIEQDYFSPQALGYFYLLVIMAAVFATWRAKPSPLFAGLRKNLHFRMARSRRALQLSRLKERGADPSPGTEPTSLSVFDSWRPRLVSAAKARRPKLVSVFDSWRLKPNPPIFGTQVVIQRRYVHGRVASLFARLEGRDTTKSLNTVQTLGVLGLLVLIMFALAMSHELTPYALILMLAGCLISRHLGRPELLAVAVLLALGWLSLGASDYWLGHLSDIFGGFGQIGSTLTDNVANRIAGSSVHQFAVNIRIYIILGIYLLAGVGVLRRATDSRVLEVVAVAPFFLLVVSSYVGEGLLRVVLYALPFTSLLAASAILPQQSGLIRSWLPDFRIFRYGRSSHTVIWTLVFSIVLASALATTVARGGNDDYESFTKGELDAVNYVYNHVTPGATVGTISPYLPFNQRSVGSVYWVSLYTSGSPTIKEITTGLLQIHAQYVVLSQSQENWGEIVAGFPKGWESRVFLSLATHGFHVVAAWPTASVLQVDPKIAKKG